MPDLLLIMRRQGNLRVLRNALSEHGYQVDGVSARSELEARLLAPASPDAALVDVTGYQEEIWEMCRLLQRSRIPFLVVSGSTTKDFGHKGLGYGAASVLEKPLVKSSLLELLSDLTRRSC